MTGNTVQLHNDWFSVEVWCRMSSCTPWVDFSPFWSGGQVGRLVAVHPPILVRDKNTDQWAWAPARVLGRQCYCSPLYSRTPARRFPGLHRQPHLKRRAGAVYTTSKPLQTTSFNTQVFFFFFCQIWQTSVPIIFKDASFHFFQNKFSRCTEKMNQPSVRSEHVYKMKPLVTRRLWTVCGQSYSKRMMVLLIQTSQCPIPGYMSRFWVKVGKERHYSMYIGQRRHMQKRKIPFSLWTVCDPLSILNFSTASRDEKELMCKITETAKARDCEFCPKRKYNIKAYFVAQLFTR